MPEPPSRPLPYRIVVGVTGHRNLPAPALAAAVRKALEGIAARASRARHTPVAFSAVSALAEGADRVVAQEVLALPGGRLDVVLPLPEQDYLADFATEASREEFRGLLGQARSIRDVAGGADRPDRYAAAGRKVVDRCDVLLAAWDGQPAAGRGGTAEVITYARDRECPLLWLRPEGEGFRASEERLERVVTSALDELDAYNGEAPDTAELAREIAAKAAALREAIAAYGLPAERAARLETEILPHLARADLLAARYRRRYDAAALAVPVLAAAAVGVMALGTAFPGSHFPFGWIEVALMLAVLGIAWAGRRSRWRDRWIDARFLAERARATGFLAMLGEEVARLRPARVLSLAYEEDDWLLRANLSLSGEIASLREPAADSEAGVRRFLGERWLAGQRDYHRAAAHRHEGALRRLQGLGVLLFGAALLVAVLHAVHLLHHPLLTAVAITLPAAGGAVAAIRASRELERSARRSEEMARHLDDLAGRLRRARTRAEVLRAVHEAEATLRHEVEDWRILFQFHDLEGAA